ncbi:MAG: hypothetical protein M1813_006623 [Trichoglossum hirsutum]|nr:MAG: hypothetical protein M1813_006623 [Trichoglossum hirsutum]
MGIYTRYDGDIDGIDDDADDIGAGAPLWDLRSRRAGRVSDGPMIGAHNISTEAGDTEFEIDSTRTRAGDAQSKKTTLQARSGRVTKVQRPRQPATQT